MKVATTMFLRVFGFRSVLIYNAVLSSAAIIGFGLFQANTSRLLIFTMLLIAGCFHSLQFTALNAIAYADIADHEVSPATSLFSTIQQLSLGMGVTVGAFALQSANFLQRHKAIVTEDFKPAFLVVGLIAMASAYSALSLSSNAGADLAGRDVQE
jgi:hypothetical protein